MSRKVSKKIRERNKKLERKKDKENSKSPAQKQWIAWENPVFKGAIFLKQMK